MNNEVKVMFWAKTEKAGMVRITRNFFHDVEEDFDEFSSMVEDELEDWVCGDRIKELGVGDYGMKMLQ
jgi:hypothetical protein